MSGRRLLATLLLPPALACSEYDFSKGGDPPPDTGRDIPADTLDTAVTTGTTPGTGDGAGADGDDTGGGGGTGGGGDTPATSDRCYEPEDGYDQNPAAKLIVTDPAAVTVTFLFSDTDYDDDLFLDAPESMLLTRAWMDSTGSTVTFGPYDAGTELVFGIDVRDTGDHWKSGPANRNDDGVVHVAVTYEGDCAWQIGFEDLRGGGDLDFNDVILRVQGMLRQED